MSSRDKASRTLDALVDEAYQAALDKGTAITNPDKWRAWKRNVYAETAKREGAGYLRKHYERLGLGATNLETPRCHACDLPIVTPTRRDDDASVYCSYKCAGIEAMTFQEFLQTLSGDRRQQLQRLLRPGQEADL